MSTRQSLKRVAKLESLMRPQSHKSFTLEELCRSLWRDNKKRFIEIAESTNYCYSLFVYQFQQEDADAAAAARLPASRRWQKSA